MTLSTPTLSKQRQFGLLEKYQLSKTLTNCYGSVTCSAQLLHQEHHRDTSTDNAATLSFYLNHFYPAIRTLVRIHPFLALNVREPGESSGHFVHISEFPLDQIVSIHEVTGTLEDAISAACDEELVKIDHDSNLPLWRLQVLLQPDAPDRCTVIFLAHHVVIDGTSLIYFWQAFLEALNSPNPVPAKRDDGGIWMVTTTTTTNDTDSLILAPPMEARPALPKPSYLDYGVLTGNILKDLVVPKKLQYLLGLTSKTLDLVWQGDTAAIDGEPHKTATKLRKVDGKTWQTVMQLAKEKYQISVHAVLHAAFLMAWSEIYVAQPVKVTTPVNCRPLAKVPKGELGNFVGEYTHLWTADTLVNPPSTGVSTFSWDLLWRLATYYHTALQENKQRSPISGQYLALLDYPKGYVGWWHDKRKKSRMGREGGLEHSDLGRFEIPSATATTAELAEKMTWTLDELWFAQSAQTYSTALGLNTITLKGALYASFTWQRGSVDEAKVAKVLDRFVEILQNCTL